MPDLAEAVATEAIRNAAAELSDLIETVRPPTIWKMRRWTISPGGATPGSAILPDIPHFLLRMSC